MFLFQLITDALEIEHGTRIYFTEAEFKRLFTGQEDILRQLRAHIDMVRDGGKRSVGEKYSISLKHQDSRDGSDTQPAADPVIQNIQDKKRIKKEYIAWIAVSLAGVLTVFMLTIGTTIGYGWAVLAWAAWHLSVFSAPSLPMKYTGTVARFLHGAVKISTGKNSPSFCNLGFMAWLSSQRLRLLLCGWLSISLA